jgi:hypothetical protein
MVTTKLAPVVVGLVVFVFGLAGALGAVPGLSVTCGPGCGSGSPVTASFTHSTGYNGVGYVLTVKDTSTWETWGLPWHSSVYFDTISWGDATGTESQQGGQTFFHTYPIVAGTGVHNYAVSDVMNVKYCESKTVQGVSEQTCDYYSASDTQTIGIGSTLTVGIVPANTAVSPADVTSSVNPSFTYSYTGLALSVTDTTSATGNATVTATYVDWDVTGVPNTPIASGATVSYTYASAGTYNVTELVTWTPGAGTSGVTVSASAYVALVSGTTGSGSSTPAFGTTFSYNAFTGLLMSAGLALVVLALVPGSIEIRVVGGLVVVAVVTAFGYVVGGF